MAQLTEGQFATIEWVLKRYRDAQDGGSTQAIADAAPDLDAWLRSLLEIVKSHQVTWIPCKKRMPDTSRHVWTAPVLELDITPVAAWYADQWWIDDRPLGATSITHWAEIRLPEPPEKEEVNT